MADTVDWERVDGRRILDYRTGNGTTGSIRMHEGVPLGAFIHTLEVDMAVGLTLDRGG